MLRKALVISILTHLSACGFKPLYSTAEISPILEQVKLGQVKLGAYPSKGDYSFRSELENFLGTVSNGTSKRYVLDVDLSKANMNYGTQQNLVNTRNLQLLTASYKLKEIDSDKIITSGTQKIMDSYEVSVSPYASIVSEDETTNRLAKSLAREVLLRLEDVIPDASNQIPQ